MVADPLKAVHTYPPSHEINEDLLQVGGPVPVSVVVCKPFVVVAVAWVDLEVVVSCPSDLSVFDSLETL